MLANDLLKQIVMKIKEKISAGIHTLKFRLMVLITGVLLIVVGIPVAIFVYHLDKNYKTTTTNMLETTTNMTYQFIYEGMMARDKDMIQRNLEFLAVNPSIESLRIYKTNGEIVFSSRPFEIEKNIKQVRNDVSYDETGSFQETFTQSGNIYSHHHPIYVQEECTPCHRDQGSVIAVMDVNASFIDSEQIYSTSKKLSIVGAVLIIVILWTVTNILYQSQIESRLVKINNGFKKLAKGDFDFRIRMKGEHELAMLAKKFNETVVNLKSAKEKEEQYYQDKLERADRLVTLGEVAAEIAHEVNNPAGIILTRAEFLRDEMEQSESRDQCVQDLGIIIQQTEKIADITRSILHFGRKLPRSFSNTNLHEVIHHSLKVLSPKIKKHKTEVDLNLPKEHAQVWGSFNQLEQVFCNLINNSLDFVPATTGKINIEIKQNDMTSNKETFQIIYKDNGPGILEADSNKIFTPFFTTKTNGKGTGLGLFIAKNIINNHKGTMILDKNNGEGACFIMELEKYNGES